MAKMKRSEKSYSIKLLASLRNLLSARDVLPLRHIRRDCLHYFFAFPVAMVLINAQDFLLSGSADLFGLSHTTVTFLAFVAGAIVMFALSTRENISLFQKSPPSSPPPDFCRGFSFRKGLPPCFAPRSLWRVSAAAYPAEAFPMCLCSITPSAFSAVR